MDSVIIKIAREVEDKWERVLQKHKKLSIEKKIQKIIHIPLKDVKNIMNEKL
jgi:hypothetical protein